MSWSLLLCDGFLVVSSLNEENTRLTAWLLVLHKYARSAVSGYLTCVGLTGKPDGE